MRMMKKAQIRHRTDDFGESTHSHLLSSFSNDDGRRYTRKKVRAMFDRQQSAYILYIIPR